jgi:hypothetical protein
MLSAWLETKLCLFRPANKSTESEIGAAISSGRDITAMEAIGVENKANPDFGGGPR